MERESILAKISSLKTGAMVCLTLLLLYVISQLAAVYQTRHELESPIIPESTIWLISKQYILKAFVASIVNVIALILYFFDKYLIAIILVTLTLVAERYIYTLH
jgi:hypothetical protein